MASAGVIAAGRSPNVTYNWLEWLEGWGMVSFYGCVMPGNCKVYEQLDAARTGAKAVTNTNWSAQTFTIGSVGTNETFYINKIWLDGQSNPQLLMVEVQATTGGVPNGTILGRFNYGGATAVSDEDGATPNPNWVEFDLVDVSNPIKLLASGVYALVVHGYTGVGANLGRNNAAGYAGGAKYDSVDAGANWAVVAGVDLLFKVFGSVNNPYSLTSQTITSASPVSKTMIKESEEAIQFALVSTIDFMGKINKSAIIQGDAFVQYTLAQSNVLISYAQVGIYHINVSGTETLLGEGIGQSGTGVGIQIELTRQKISPGEKILLRFKMYFVDDIIVEGTSYISLAHSGSNLVLHMPFKTDL